MTHRQALSSPPDPDPRAERTGYLIIPDAIAHRTDLSQTAKMLYASITRAEHYHRQYGRWPTHELFARWIGATRKAVMAAGSELERAGLVRIRRKRGARNQYELPTKRSPDSGLLSPGSASRTSPNLGLLPAQKESQFGTRRSPDSGLQGVPIPDSYTNQQNKPQQQQNEPGAPADAAADLCPDERARLAYLQRAGVCGAPLWELARDPRLTVAQVGDTVAQWERTDRRNPGLRNPQAVLVERLRAMAMATRCGPDLAAHEQRAREDRRQEQHQADIARAAQRLCDRTPDSELRAWAEEILAGRPAPEQARIRSRYRDRPWEEPSVMVEIYQRHTPRHTPTRPAQRFGVDRSAVAMG